MTAGEPPPTAPEPETSLTPKAGMALGEEDTSEQSSLPRVHPEDDELRLGASATTAHMTLLPGYELLGLLGRGGTSVVYKARHSNLRRLVALKMILGGAHAMPEQLMRFRIEAETVAKLQHPNIVQIYEVGVYESCTYLALEYVEGKTIAEKHGGKPAPSAEAARIVEAVARGIQHAHERGVVHRDLKPANVLLTKDGTPKIADFGLAKHDNSESMPSLRMSIQGTPSYMAPEQAAVDKEGDTTATIAVDVYALGGILYELLTGRPPFLGSDLKETVRMVLEEQPVPPHRHNPDVPEDLELICLKCLQKDPHQRYATAEMLAEDLSSYLQHQPIQARPPTLLAFLTRWRRAHPGRSALFAGAILLVILLLGVAAGTAWSWHDRWMQEQRQADHLRDELRTWQGRVRQLLDYNQILQRQPTDLDTLWRRAQLYQQMQEPQLALADCEVLLAKLNTADTRRGAVNALMQQLQMALSNRGSTARD